MPSTNRTSPAPVSRATARPRGAKIIPALGLACSLFFLPSGPVVAQKAPCLPFCDPMNLDVTSCCETPCLIAECDAFTECQKARRFAVNECVANECVGRGALGGCSAALNCSRSCNLRAGNCSDALRSGLQSTCGDCRIGRGAARRDCNRCRTGSKEPPVCRGVPELTDTTGSGCPERCSRLQPWIIECYGKCDDRCAGDRCAVAVCRRTCRDSICQVLRNTCVPEGASFRNVEQRGLHDDYLQCCGESRCAEDSEDDVICETTTSTTSSTSTTSTAKTKTTSTSSTSTTLR